MQRFSRTSKTEESTTNVNSVQDNAVLFMEIQNDHTIVFPNIAKATSAHRTLVVLLTKTMAEITTQVTSLTANVLTKKSENAHLKNHDIIWLMQVPQLITLRSVTEILMRRAEKSLTPTGIVHLTGLRSRKPILPQLAATSLMDIKNCRRDWKLREEKNVTSIGSMADQPREGGRD